MDADCGDRDGRVPLPEADGPDPAERTRGRRDGIGRARRVSNWTAAALIAGTGAAAVMLAHEAAPGAGTAVQAARPAACAQAGNAPQVTHPVATTSASGVTTTTTTRTANCQTIVTQVRNVPARADD